VASKARSQQGRRIVMQGRRYWSDAPTSKGKTAGIGYALHSGSFTRCVSRVQKFLGPRAKGYCANRFHDATHSWPGSRANRGKTSRSKSR
jgi:hypothetical protein